MYLARVIGSLVATTVIEGAEGVALRWVRPERSDGSPAGGALVAFDPNGQAPEGELVYLIDGREATIPLPDQFVPADATIVGIVDRVDLDPHGSRNASAAARPATRSGGGSAAR